MGSILKILNAIPLVLGTILMLFISAVTVTNVIARYIFNHGLSWADETARFGLIWITFLGAAVLVRLGEHITVDLFVDRMPRFLQTFCYVLSQLIKSSVAMVLIWKGMEQVSRQSGQISPGLEANMGMIYTVIPFAGLYMLVYAVINLVHRAKGINDSPFSTEKPLEL